MQQVFKFHAKHKALKEKNSKPDREKEKPLKIQVERQRDKSGLV